MSLCSIRLMPYKTKPHCSPERKENFFWHVKKMEHYNKDTYPNDKRITRKLRLSMKQEGSSISHWIEKVTVSITNKVCTYQKENFGSSCVTMDQPIFIYYIFIVSLLTKPYFYIKKIDAISLVSMILYCKPTIINIIHWWLSEVPQGSANEGYA